MKLVSVLYKSYSLKIGVLVFSFLSTVSSNQFFLAIIGRFQKHRKDSKWTFPIWQYVSITGVVIFFMLKFIG
ncbi:MAG: DUF420 domain-containing protein [Balneola sp.]